MGNQQQNTNTNPQNVYDTQKSQTDVNRSLYNVMKRYSNKNSSTIPQNPQMGFPNEGQNMLTRAMSFVPKYKYTITAKMLKDTFKTYAIDGDYLNKDRFDDAIESIFRFPDLPEMHYTYLSEKIYYLIDDSGDGKIQEDEFVPGLSNVLSDRNFRIKCIILFIMMYSINDGNDDCP